MIEQATKPVSREPHLVERPSQTMAVIYTQGEPRSSADRALPALYSAVYHLRSVLKREGRAFKIDHLRARWPDAHRVPRERWTAIWGLPIPADVKEIIARKAGFSVLREVWDYGLVAEILHVGPYASEGDSVRALHAFIAEQGYETSGPHEEEYLTARRARTQQTLIRYPIRPKP
ncbi:MAG TPA: hypothetical protein VLV45_02025 [Gemmatimonadales bacterium]|nr:hypothetical protein [Gemmatimonadales bacterium]